jgi:peptidyl-tRNA hydrolase, PTH1 family
MKLIVGLGNVGRKYDRTRHNVGFEVLNRLADRFGEAKAKEKFDGQVMDAAIAGTQIRLLWPHTLMNRSGRSVGPAVEFYRLELNDLLVVCDDFNLPLGKLRFRRSGSAGGHNGLQDLITRLGSQDFSRLRIGVGPVPENWDTVDFVLGRFTAEETKEIDGAVVRAAEGVECWVADGTEASMNRFNG